MSYEWFIARRYFAARRRSGILSFITSFTVAGIALGSAALIITLSILAGFEKEIQDKAVGFTSHIQVQGFRNKLLTGHAGAIERIKEQVPGVQSIAPFAAREAMIRVRGEVDGIFLKGIDRSSDVSIVSGHIVEGRFLSDTRPGSAQIVIGRKLAIRLNASVGDKVVVFGLPGEAGASIRPRAMAFVLQGIYETGMAEYDDIYAYTTLAEAQKLLQTGDAITGYDILVRDITQVEEIATKVQGILGYPHYARTVFQQYRNLFSWVELQKKMSPILLTLIMVVATINVIGTILMTVLDKASSIGVLRTLGATRGSVGRIFLLQGIIMACVGTILGNCVAFVLLFIQSTFHVIAIPADIYYMSSVPVLMRPEHFVLVSLLTVLLCLLTSIIPSRAATGVDAVRILRFG